MVMSANRLNTNQQEIDVQHVTDYCLYARLRLNPMTGTLLIRAIAKDGEVSHRELFTYTEIDFFLLHNGDGWYLPEVERVLDLMDERRRKEKGRSLV